MLVLSDRFALLLAFCSLATMTFSPRWGVGAAAIQSRLFLDHGHCHNVTSDGPSAQYVLPLPLQSKTKVRTHKWLYSNPVALLADMVFTYSKRDDNTPWVACRPRKDGGYRGPAEMARRSVLIPNNHGSEYVVSHSKRPVHQRRRRLKDRMPLSRRSKDAIPGNVALMSPDYGSDTGRQIATLFAAPNGPGAWILYASETNQTQFQLVPTVESTSDLTPVTLEMGAPGETRTCATYDSSPPQDESDTQDSENMTMEPCTDQATPEVGYKSQIFMYNTTSSTLVPTWTNSTNKTIGSSSVNGTSTSSSNTTSAVQAAATLFANRTDTPRNSTRQNSTVTLVFTPVKAMIANVGIEENSTTTGTTITMTKTITVFDVDSSTSTRVLSSTSNTAQVTATQSALDVQLVGAPIPTSNATGTTTIGSATSTTTTGSINAAAIASRIAASAYASSITMSSSTDSASSSSTQSVQRRENERLAVSTEPYTWMFKKLKAEER